VTCELEPELELGLELEELQAASVAAAMVAANAAVASFIGLIWRPSWRVGTAVAQ
jgi:hypothetical protein